MLPPSPLLASGLHDRCPQLYSAERFHIAKSWREQGRGHAEFPRKLCGNSLSCIALQKENSSEQRKYRLFNMKILSLPILCQSLLHVMLSKLGTYLNVSTSLGCSSFKRTGLWLRDAEQPSESLVSKYWMVSTSGALHVSVSWPLRKP